MGRHSYVSIHCPALHCAGILIKPLIVSKNIYLPDITPYIMNDSLIGPNQFINIYPPDNETFGVLCNGTQTPVVEFSVEINGKIELPITLACLADLSRELRCRLSCESNRFDSAYKHDGRNRVLQRWGYEIDDWYFTRGHVPEECLSVSMGRFKQMSRAQIGPCSAYRFPTGDCPGYWGFATPRGGKTPTSTQKPKSTPADAKTCLSFTTLSSTPTPTIAVNNGIPSSGQKYSVYNRPNDEWVTLRGVDDLPPLKVAGGIYGFGE